MLNPDVPSDHIENPGKGIRIKLAPSDPDFDSVKEITIILERVARVENRVGMLGVLVRQIVSIG